MAVNGRNPGENAFAPAAEVSWFGHVRVSLLRCGTDLPRIFSVMSGFLLGGVCGD
jgi:hypothetical protein